MEGEIRLGNDGVVATGDQNAAWSPHVVPPAEVGASAMAPPLWEECSPYACTPIPQAASCWTRPDGTPKLPPPSLRPTLGPVGVHAHAAMTPARSPINSSPGSSFHFLESGQLLGTMQAAAEDRSLPPTPRSPSPTCSPPSSPKRHRNEEARSARSKDVQQSTKVEGAGHISDSAAEDDLEIRAAALGLNETTQRVWRETNLPPTPSSPSPTFSPPSSPKQRRQAELVAEQAAAVLAASLRAGPEQRGAEVSCDSDSDSNMNTHLQGVGLPMAPPDYWGGRDACSSAASSLPASSTVRGMRKKRHF
ncbi:hypothetical protein AB1Y20_022211 [Prymnesium parvum]|uniref:Uncharacterized protein n=1 Tax=Prymnesium parvum TaxID=97485 RepID=A0AB34JGJ4_PRYPA